MFHTRVDKRIYQQLIDTDSLIYVALSLTGQHAVHARRKADRYDPALALECYNRRFALFS